MVLIVAAVWTFQIGIDALTRRRLGGQQPPPRPEWLREQFERKPIGGALGYAITAMFFLPFIVPGVLLLALSDGDQGRSIGVALTAWAVGLLAIGIRRGRPAQRKRDQERMLARSEAFWSRPDAEEWAAKIRAPKGISRNR